MQLLPDDIRGQGLGVAALHQNTTDRIPGFIVQGPKPRASLDDFKAAVMNPPQPAVALTHRYPLSQQAPKVLRLGVISAALAGCMQTFTSQSARMTFSGKPRWAPACGICTLYMS